MKQAQIIEKYLVLQRRSAAVGITLQLSINDQFAFRDVPRGNGLILFETLDHVEQFVKGYEMAYRINNDRIPA